MFFIQHHDCMNILEKEHFHLMCYRRNVIYQLRCMDCWHKIPFRMLHFLVVGQTTWHLWSCHTFERTWIAHVKHDWIAAEDTLKPTKENSVNISSSSSHLLHCEDGTYNMAALTSISTLQWKGWIWSLLGCIPNKIQASARNLYSTGMDLPL